MTTPGNRDRYSRQERLPEIGAAGQEKLAGATVLVLGCGALGTASAELLARAGVGRLVLADRDVVEFNNLQRQVLFNEDDARNHLPKAEAAARHLRGINGDIDIEAVVTDVTRRNIVKLAGPAHLVVDGTDNLETRFLINDACLRLQTPWVYGGAIGTTGMVMPVVPGEGPCLRCLVPQAPPAGTLPTCETAGVLGMTTVTVGALQAAAAVRLLTGGPARAGSLTHVDPWAGTFQQIQVTRGRSCPACVEGKLEYLDDDSTASWTVRMCGCNAVQVTPPRPPDIALEDLARRLAPAADRVEFTGLVLLVEVEGVELTVFPDGRTLVRGTPDEARARTLYARYIGT